MTARKSAVDSPEAPIRPAGEATRLLKALADGKPGAFERLLPIVYEELRAIADRLLVGERRGHKLQPTALVHEAYLRLRRAHGPDLRDRGHFLAVASRAMRQILVDHAVGRRAAKRGGGRQRVPLDDVVDQMEERCVDLVGLNDLLVKLASVDPLQSKTVELRFFGGLTMAETAEAIGMSLRTAEREWTHARAWIRREFGGGMSGVFE